jgi:VanZ family protein
VTRSRRRGGPVSAAWFPGAVVLILLATLPPQPEWRSAAAPILRPVLPRVIRWGDIGQNLALYAPLGLLLAVRGSSLLSACGVSASVSLGTELLQYYIPGRDSAALDVVINTLGALIAFTAARSTRLRGLIVRALGASECWLVRARNPSSRQAGALCLGWSLLAVSVLTLTGVLLMPVPPPAGIYAVASPLLDSSRGPLRIGSQGVPAGFFNGTIDEVRIYHSARTEEQIRNDMLVSAARSSAADPRLVAAFAFDSDSGAVARDETGHGHDGAVSNASWTDRGRLGGALIFNGRSSEVVVADSAALDLTDAMTLEAWILLASEPGIEPAVISRSGTIYYLHGPSRVGQYAVQAGGRFGAIPRWVALNEPIPLGTWTHLAVTYDGQSMRLYVDGALTSRKVLWSPHRPARISLNGVDLRPGVVEDPGTFGASLLDSVALDLVLTCGSVDDLPAPAFLVGGIQSTEPLALIASGSDVFVKPLARAARFGLASPATRVSGALSGCAPGNHLPLTVRGRLQNPEIRRAGERLQASTPGVGSGWAFLIHSDLLPAWAERTGTIVWLALLAAPLGLWARWTALGTAGMSVAILTLLYLPHVVHVRALNGDELAGLLIGAAVGLVGHARLR